MSSAASPRAELHLPDLPEVSVQLGGPPGPPEHAAPRPRQPWRHRLLQALSSYLPLLLMALLAAGTWWLVRHTPTAPGASPDKPQRVAPDYTMDGFSITRFGADGRVLLRIDGDQLRHYPATDRLEVDNVRIHAVGADGRVTEATARRALANADASEVQLLGAARVVSRTPGARGQADDVLEVRGEFLHAFLRFERLRSHLPVQVLRAGSEVRAGGLEYDHLSGQARLQPPVQARFTPGARRPPEDTR